MHQGSALTIQPDIEAIFADYVQVPSYTNTRNERLAEQFLESWFSEQAYFIAHPDLWGRHPLENDPLNRHVVWGMVRGGGNDTIVMIHHSDVVEIEDFETARPFAHDICRINEELRSMKHKFSPEAAADLAGGQWQFGRGSADMKAGGAIQLALIKYYSQCPDFTGNLILLCLPDEENLSAGMRSAVNLLADLKYRFGLDYLLMINSEPQQGTDPESMTVYEGSVGKLMPVVYIRGSLAHVGRIFDGLNPLHLMSELVVRTELNMAFSDRIGEEASPPPSWLYLKDTKTHYDVSIPTTVQAYLSVLTLDTRPDECLRRLTSEAEKAFDTVIQRMNQSYAQFLLATGQPAKPLPWAVNVKTFSQLYQAALQSGREEFTRAWRKKLDRIGEMVSKGLKGLPQSSFELIELCLEFIDDKQPLMVIGLSPPYYPDVSNSRIPYPDERIRDLIPAVQEFCGNVLNRPCALKKFYTGISDLSYSFLEPMQDPGAAVADNMPLWGNIYQIPFEKISEIRMPCINIGPWGKDFHKLTERVLIKDLYDRTPRLIRFVIEYLLTRPR